MRTLIHAALLVLWLVVPGYAQPPAPAAAPPADQPTLPRDVQLERDNLLLQARVNELETQLAALKAQFINERIAQQAPAVIQRLQAAAPDFDVNPQTLVLTRKTTAAAGVVPPAPGSATGAVAPPSPQPQR